MNHHQRSIHVGLAAIACALAIRGGEARLFLPARNLRWETPGIPRQTAHYTPEPSTPAESAAPALAEQTLPPLPRLPRYTRLPEVRITTGQTPDLQALLEQPLNWQLTGEKPTVLILHTHTTESYTSAGEDYLESGPWRTLEEDYNMCAIGARVEEILEGAGIRVLRDRTTHDYPSYNGSYGRSRATLQALLAENPSIRLVLDLHRDAADAPGGGQYRTAAPDGVTAQLMAVMGGGYAGWEENLALALKLCAQLESQLPGITRPIQLRGGHFNQDLCPGAVLWEVGAAGNTQAEALLAAEQLARAVIALAQGTGAGEAPPGVVF